MKYEDRLKEGDLVRHRTGGPEMIIISENENKMFCRWYTADKANFITRWFYMHELKLVKEEIS